jgi:hypothetical protein
MKVQVKIGMIKLLDTILDLCEQIKSVGKQCPLPKGDLFISHTFDIPPEAPPVSISPIESLICRTYQKLDDRAATTLTLQCLQKKTGVSAVLMLISDYKPLYTFTIA